MVLSWMNPKFGNLEIPLECIIGKSIYFLIYRGWCRREWRRRRWRRRRWWWWGGGWRGGGSRRFLWDKSRKVCSFKALFRSNGSLWRMWNSSTIKNSYRRKLFARDSRFLSLSRYMCIKRTVCQAEMNNYQCSSVYYIFFFPLLFEEMIWKTGINFLYDISLLLIPYHKCNTVPWSYNSNTTRFFIAIHFNIQNI